jgi:iron complex transport system substrate-binding protein
MHERLTTTTDTTTDTYTLDTLARRAPATDNLIELAGWLHTNGSQHLSAIERIELAERLITRRRFLIGAGALVLAGCGMPSSSAPTATVAATREITDLYGRKLTIPANPQRIVTIDYSGPTVYLTALGFNVIGATDFASNPVTLPSEFVGGKTFESIGGLEAVNFETVARLKPDLIVASVIIRENFAPGEAIAPVIGITDDVLDKLPKGPFGLLRYLGEVLERQSQAEAIEREVRQKIERFDLLRGKRALAVAPLNYAAPVNFAIIPIAGPFPNLLELLGYVTTPSEVEGKSLVSDYMQISLERAVEVLSDCEAIIAVTAGLYGKDAEPMGFLEQFKAHPVWSRVPAVERGDVAYVEAETINFGWGPRGVDVMLKQLTEQLGS